MSSTRTTPTPQPGPGQGARHVRCSVPLAARCPAACLLLNHQRTRPVFLFTAIFISSDEAALPQGPRRGRVGWRAAGRGRIPGTCLRGCAPQPVPVPGPIASGGSQGLLGSPPDLRFLPLPHARHLRWGHRFPNLTPPGTAASLPSKTGAPQIFVPSERCKTPAKRWDGGNGGGGAAKPCMGTATRCLLLAQNLCPWDFRVPGAGCSTRRGGFWHPGVARCLRELAESTGTCPNPARATGRRNVPGIPVTSYRQKCLSEARDQRRAGAGPLGCPATTWGTALPGSRLEPRSATRTRGACPGPFEGLP